MSRGQLQPLEDPAEAIGSAKCWFARSPISKEMRDEGVRFHVGHPEPCAFCHLPEDLILERLNAFLDWAGARPETVRTYRQVGSDKMPTELTSPLRASVELFMAAAPHEQHAMVIDAMYPSIDPKTKRELLERATNPGE